MGRPCSLCGNHRGTIAAVCPGAADGREAMVQDKGRRPVVSYDYCAIQLRRKSRRSAWLDRGLCAKYCAFSDARLRFQRGIHLRGFDTEPPAKHPEASRRGHPQGHHTGHASERLQHHECSHYGNHPAPESSRLSGKKEEWQVGKLTNSTKCTEVGRLRLKIEETGGEVSIYSQFANKDEWDTKGVHGKRFQPS